MPPEPTVSTGRRHSVNTRLAALALIIYARGRVTGEELAAELGITPRTIYRDIARLQHMGLPIATAPGPGGGFMIDDTAGVDLAVPGGDGLLDLLTRAGVLAGNSSPDATLEAILGHVGAELDPADRHTIAKVRERILFDPEEWYTRSRPPGSFYQLRDAVIHDRQLRLRHIERDGTKADDLFDPHALVWKGGAWYLFGLSHTTGAARRIRVNRIIEIHATETTFARPAGVDLAESWKRHLEDFGKGTSRVVLHIAAEAIAEFQDFNWKRENKITKRDTHWLVEMRVDDDAWLVPLVLSYAGAVTVLEPADLRNRIKASAQAALAAHDDQAQPQPAGPDRSPSGDLRKRAGIHRLSLSD